jgi:hypothetical protein
MALGSLIIKQKTGHSDEDVLQDIVENPYMQFLIGLHEFTTVPPFSASAMTHFRKYISKDMMDRINNDMFGGTGDNKNDSGDSGGNGNDDNNEELGKEAETVENKGTLILDAVCAPADIAYPTDVNLLNEAREKLEGMIDTVHPPGYFFPKPRTYRKKARKDYLDFIYKKKPGKDIVKKAIGKQLRYVSRNLKHVDKMLSKFSADDLSGNQRQWLETIRKLYEQQLFMYKNNTHSVENRIVSISQPHVRPIIRGKARAPVEFGAKISISLVDGYAFVDRLGWDAYNEATELIPALNAYKEKYGTFPERVLADRLYRNRDNLKFCKANGIRMSGPRLGRPPAETDYCILKQMARDSADRNAVEGKFGEGKTKYGLDRIMARLKDSSETVIAISFFCMNISRKLRLLFRFFSIPNFNCFLLHDFYIGVFQ